MFLRHCLLLTLASVAAAPAAAAASVVAATAVAAMRIEAAVTCEAAVMCEAAAMCEVVATDAVVLVSAVQAWAWAGTAWVAEVEPAQTEAGALVRHVASSSSFRDPVHLSRQLARAP